MTYRLDPELVPIMAAQAERSAEVPVPARDDWKAVRQAADSVLNTTTWSATARTPGTLAVGAAPPTLGSGGLAGTAAAGR